MAIVVLVPLLAAIALVVRVTSKGPAIFRQIRTGRHGTPFVMLKFRTMVEDAPFRRDELIYANEADTPLFKIDDDPRATRFGRALRRTHLDELPQLLNVLRGDMSLVGPRPLPPEEAAAVTTTAPHRHDVRPGMTGLWQVSGGASLSTEELCELDSVYVRSMSLGLDCRILARTVSTLVRAMLSRPGEANKLCRRVASKWRSSLVSAVLHRIG
jgi:lipopolysaccharide/colanic/teichoic acid biosynthesis glycosyltransferase